MTASTNSESTALAVVQGFDLSPRNFDEAWRMAEYLADSDMVPKDFKGKPANCLVAIQWGGELGLKTMQAIQNIAVINGRPSLWGDVMLALVRASPLCEYVVENVSGEKAECKVKRRGEPEQTREFTKEDATKAGLWTKDGPWKNYPKRMLQMRARAWALRDVFTDVLKGLHMAEEAFDMPPPEKFMGDVERVDTPRASTAPAASNSTTDWYPQEKFDHNFAQWEGIVQSKRKTHGAMIAFIEAKGQKLSEEQKARINSIKVKHEDAFTAPTFAEVVDKIAKAKNRDELTVAGDLIRHIADATLQPEAQQKFDARERELTQ